MSEPHRDRVDELIIEGRIDRVERDRAAVERMLRQASRNVDGAHRELAAHNPTGAQVLLWDAIRQAIAAHMLTAGLRVTSTAGHHVTVVQYARTRLGAILHEADLHALDRIRRARNAAEYDAVLVSSATVTAYLQTAVRVVEGVAGDVGA